MTTVYQIGQHLVCIRASHDWLDEMLRALLEKHVQPDLTAPHANYSIRIEASDARIVGDPIHLLYSGGCLVARSRKPLDVLVALFRDLAVNELDVDDQVVVRCTALVSREDRAVLLSAAARRQVVQQSRQLKEVGLHVIDTPAVVIDPTTLEAVIPTPTFAYDPQAFGAVRGIRRADVETVLAERRYPIAAWVFMSLPGDLAPARRALALTKAASALWNGEPRQHQPVGTLAAVLRQADTLAAGDFTSHDLIAQLVQRWQG